MKAGAAAVLKSTRGELIVVEDVRAEAAINDLFAEVTVTQRYWNPETTNIEAVYTFPLPLDGVLLGFEVEIGERRLLGTVVEKAEGERHYEDAIADGDTAVLLAQAGSGLYTASIGNLLPGEMATIRFQYGLLLRWNGDRVRFAMPTTIAPRYGEPASAGLAPHQAPKYAFDQERALSLRVAVRGLLKDARFNSPSHSVRVTQEGKRLSSRSPTRGRWIETSSSKRAHLDRKSRVRWSRRTSKAGWLWPRGAALRPERHAPNSISTLRTVIAVALVNRLPRCPCCMRKRRPRWTPFMTQ